MSFVQRFTFGPFSLDRDKSIITFTYHTKLSDGDFVEWIDRLEFPTIHRDTWGQIPEELLRSFLQTLSLIHGVNYWKVHCAAEMHIQGFSLTQEQVPFWNTLYTKGLGEFYFKSGIDFRNLVSFPAESRKNSTKPISIQTKPISLLLNGGGKDSIVSAELLKEHELPFDIFMMNPVGMQKQTARQIGKPSIQVYRRTDQKYINLRKSRKLYGGLPGTSMRILTASLYAALYGYRYVVLSNESSADIGNVSYLGLDVNHQWCKSSEAEKLVNDYVNDFVTPSIVSFSLLRPFSEIEITRRFSHHKKYFRSFASCNSNFILPASVAEGVMPGHAYWCNSCPKCAFIFASLSAFLPKETVIDIFGSNLYAQGKLLPMFQKLLGLEGFKPLECVGTPDEMTTAMGLAERTGFYKKDIVMAMFKKNVALSNASLERMKQKVLSSQPVASIPDEFAACIIPKIHKSPAW